MSDLVSAVVKMVNESVADVVEGRLDSEEAQETWRETVIEVMQKLVTPENWSLHQDQYEYIADELSGGIVEAIGLIAE